MPSTAVDLADSSTLQRRLSRDVAERAAREEQIQNIKFVPPRKETSKPGMIGPEAILHASCIYVVGKFLIDMTFKDCEDLGGSSLVLRLSILGMGALITFTFGMKPGRFVANRNHSKASG